jgi:hypothetical protein
MRTIDQMAIYESEDGKISIGVLYSNENLWLTQKLMAELLECSTVSMNLARLRCENSWRLQFCCFYEMALNK